MPYAEGVALPQVLDFQDTLSANMERRAGKSNAVLKPFFLMEAKRLRRYELKAMSLFDAQTIITDADRQLLPSDSKNKVAIISNGVSQRYVDAVETKEKKYDEFKKMVELSSFKRKLIIFSHKLFSFSHNPIRL